MASTPVNSPTKKGARPSTASSSPFTTPTRPGGRIMPFAVGGSAASTPTRTPTRTPRSGHARLMSLAKVRNSLDDEQRARLLDDIGDASSANTSPSTSAAGFEGGKGVTGRRRRPFVLVLAAASLILLASAGAYHSPAHVEAITSAVNQWMPAPSRVPVADELDKHIEVTPSPAPPVPDPTPSPDTPVDAYSTFSEPPIPSDTPSPTSTSEPAATPTPTEMAQTDAFALQPMPSTFPASMAQAAFLDARPHPRPPSADAAGERYLSYVPHSGFHNQRIEFQNAIAFAYMLNRTLLVPAVRLGYPQGWQASPQLQQSLERDEKQPLADECIPQLEALERAVIPGPCENYTRYSLVTWDVLVDLTPLERDVRLVERVDISRSWLTSPTGLGLNETEIETFADKSRYSFRLFDDRNDKDGLGRYQRRLNVEDLLEPAMAEKRLLEFGSFFGSGRVRVTKPETRRLGRRVDRQMVFRNPLLTRMSDEIVRQLGGRDAYVGLHLRVGDGAFKRMARQHMQEVFRRLCTDVFKLDAHTIDTLSKRSARLQRGRRPSHRRRAGLFIPQPSYTLFDDFDPLAYHHEDEVTTATLVRRAEPLQCKGELHTEPDLVELNKPIYIATDARHPRNNADLAVFFDTFPCAFVLGDFAAMPELAALEGVRSLQEGVRMAPFLYPFLEAMLAARSRIATIGTPSSTFSGFAAGTLHRVYGSEPEPQSQPVTSSTATDDDAVATAAPPVSDNEEAGSTEAEEI